jgi:uncharacterized protein (UPF0548 family)
VVDDLTYSEVGATLAPALPGGYHHLDVRRRVGPDAAFDALGDAILGWGLQRGAGLRVPAEPVSEGSSVTLRLGLRLGLVRIPVRIVRVLEEPDRRGFVYGTLAGHPETGEEAFLVERDDLGTWIHIRAFSRPGTWWSRLGSPVTSVMQRHYTERYVRAAQAAVDVGTRF